MELDVATVTCTNMFAMYLYKQANITLSNKLEMHRGVNAFTTTQ